MHRGDAASSTASDHERPNDKIVQALAGSPVENVEVDDRATESEDQKSNKTANRCIEDARWYERAV